MAYRINYTKVISQANSISDNADELQSLISKLAQYETQCRSAWKGDAADAFMARFQELLREMRKTGTQMETLASTIKACADTIREEDEKAAEEAAALSQGQ